MIRPSNPCQQSERGQILCQALKTHSECNSIWNHLVWGRKIHEMMCWVLHCVPATGNCRLTNKQTEGNIRKIQLSAQSLSLQVSFEKTLLQLWQEVRRVYQQCYKLTWHCHIWVSKMMVCVFSELKLPIPKNKEKQWRDEVWRWLIWRWVLLLFTHRDMWRTQTHTSHRGMDRLEGYSRKKKRSYHTFLIVFLYLKLWAVRENGCLVGWL